MVSIALVLFTLPLPQELPQDGVGGFDGVWKLEYEEFEGENLTQQKWYKLIRAEKYVVRAGVIQMDYFGTTIPTKIKTGSDDHFNTIDLELTTADAVIKGIYVRTQDTLIICFTSHRNAPRPTSLKKTAPGENRRIIMLRRLP